MPTTTTSPEEEITEILVNLWAYKTSILTNEETLAIYPELKDAKAKLLALLADREREARIDEVCTAFTQVVGDETVSLRSKFVKRFSTYLKERYATLSTNDRKQS